MKRLSALLVVAAIAIMYLAVKSNTAVEVDTPPKVAGSESELQASPVPTLQPSINNDSEPVAPTSSEGPDLSRELNLIQPAEDGVIDKSVIDDFFAEFTPVRKRIVTVNGEALREKIIEELANTPASPLVLTFFEDTTISAVSFSRNSYSSGYRSGFALWSGRVTNADFGTVQMMVGIGDGNGITMVSDSEKGRFRMEPTPVPPYHFLWEVDRSTLKTGY